MGREREVEDLYTVLFMHLEWGGGGGGGGGWGWESGVFILTWLCSD